MAEYTTKLAEDEVLRLENLSIQFGGLKAVDDLSFAIKEKEIFGLIGPNGAGKTTAFNCITQFYKPSSGAVYFRNKDGQVENLVDHPVHSIIRKGLVRTFQNVELVGELSIIDNVLIGGHIDFKPLDLNRHCGCRVREEKKSRCGKKRKMYSDLWELQNLKMHLLRDSHMVLEKKLKWHVH